MSGRLREGGRSGRATLAPGDVGEELLDFRDRHRPEPPGVDADIAGPGRWRDRAVTVPEEVDPAAVSVRPGYVREMGEPQVDRTPHAAVLHGHPGHVPDWSVPIQPFASLFLFPRIRYFLPFRRENTA